MTSKVKVGTALDIPNALLIYTRDNGKRQATYIPPREDEANKEANVAVEKYVRDARTSNPSPTLAEHGFQLINHGTTLTKQDFYTNRNGLIESVYYKEMANAIKKVCPDATEVKPFHHMVRLRSFQPLISTPQFCSSQFLIKFHIYTERTGPKREARNQA